MGTSAARTAVEAVAAAGSAVAVGAAVRVVAPVTATRAD
jgi:hypothetical protein